MSISAHSAWADVQAIKSVSPLVHNITNYVVMEQTANGLLAIGASPVMAHAVEEVQDMAAIASSLVLNIGTLSAPWVSAMLLALNVANDKGIPVVLDPVGAGATSYRTETANSILSQGVATAIRGNASEIVCLSGHSQSTKGVDSVHQSSDCVERAKKLAQERKCVVWMSGKTDVVTNGSSVVLIHNGHALMGKVTGMGCTATAITGAFLAVNPDPLLACVHAAVFMGIAGEIAACKANGPGSFKLAFFDALYALSFGQIEERIRVEVL